MGSSSSKLKRIPNAEELIEETGFSAAHILQLYDRFTFLDKNETGLLRPEDLETVRELDMNPIGDRIVNAFFAPGQDTVDFPTFVRILAHFRPTDTDQPKNRTQQQEPANCRTGKLRFVFQLYDQDKDGKISRFELLQVLRAMLGLQVTEEQLQSIVQRAIKEADLDKDDAISFEEFKKSLEKVDIEHKMSIRRFLK